MSVISDPFPCDTPRVFRRPDACREQVHLPRAHLSLLIAGESTTVRQTGRVAGEGPAAQQPLWDENSICFTPRVSSDHLLHPCVRTHTAVKVRKQLGLRPCPTALTRRDSRGPRQTEPGGRPLGTARGGGSVRPGQAASQTWGTWVWSWVPPKAPAEKGMKSALRRWETGYAALRDGTPAQASSASSEWGAPEPTQRVERPGPEPTGRAVHAHIEGGRPQLPSHEKSLKKVSNLNM